VHFSSLSFLGECATGRRLQVPLEGERLFPIRERNGRPDAPGTVFRSVRIAAGIVVPDATLQVLSETGVEVRRRGIRSQNIHLEESSFHKSSSFACRPAFAHRWCAEARLRGWRHCGAAAFARRASAERRLVGATGLEPAKMLRIPPEIRGSGAAADLVLAPN
jgi:hypothetical protein